MGTGRGDKTETLASEPAAEMNWPERVEPKAPTVSWREGTKARPGPQCARKGPETDEVKRTDDAAERMQPRGKRVWEVPRSWPRPRRPASFGLWSRAEPRAPAAARSPAGVRPVPFALLKEQGPHLGPGSRRWCKTALGETDRQTDRTDDEGGPPPHPLPGPGGVRPPAEGVAQPGPAPDPAPKLLTGGGGGQVRQEVGRTRRPYIYRPAPPPALHPGNVPSHAAFLVRLIGRQSRRGAPARCGDAPRLQAGGFTGGIQA